MILWNPMCIFFYQTHKKHVYIRKTKFLQQSINAKLENKILKLINMSYINVSIERGNLMI